MHGVEQRDGPTSGPVSLSEQARRDVMVERERAVELGTSHSNIRHLCDQLAKLQVRAAELDGKPLRPLAPRPPQERLSRRLTPDRLAQLVADYETGVPTTELVSRYGIAKGSVIRLLHDRGVIMRLQSPTAEQIEQAIKLYATGLSLAAVGERLGFTAHTIRRVLLGSGVQTRDSHGRER